MNQGKNITVAGSELVINATQINDNPNSVESYEFVLDVDLNIVVCNHIQSLSQRRVRVIQQADTALHGALFELNHVRVDPKCNNDLLLERLKTALLLSGVSILAPPDEIFMAVCYKPLGELSDVVRFYIKDNRLVFLSERVKLSILN
jgi:hypothetical protein